MSETAPSSTRRLALVTGASTGIGRELARQFAQNGYDVVIAADEPGIEEAAHDVGASGSTTYPCQVDLATPDGVEQLYRYVQSLGRPLEAAALNAGIGVNGSFVETRLEDHLRLVDLNVRSTVHLAKLVLHDMATRGSGKLLFTSSIAARMPGPYHSTYPASKAFVQLFAHALAHELKDTDITVTALLPGPTETDFFERADMTDTKLGQADKDDPEEVARAGFEALMAGKREVIPGSLKNRLQGTGAAILPDAVVAAAQARMVEPGSGSGDG